MSERRASNSRVRSPALLIASWSEVPRSSVRVLYFLMNFSYSAKPAEAMEGER